MNPVIITLTLLAFSNIFLNIFGMHESKIRIGEASKKLMHATKLEEMKSALLEGANINAIDGNGVPKIHYKLKTEAFYLLLEHGADIMMRNRKEETALHAAAFWGNATAVQLLLDSGADINARDKKGRTPLLVAVNRKYYHVVKVLIERGAALISDESEKSPLHYAVEQHSEEDYKKWQPKDTINTWFAENGTDASITNLLLDYGADPNAVDQYGVSVLTWAVWHSRYTNGVHGMSGMSQIFNSNALISLLQRGALITENLLPAKHAHYFDDNPVAVLALLLYGGDPKIFMVDRKKLHRLEHLALYDQLDADDLEDLNVNNRDDQQLLTRLLQWACTHSPRNVDLLISKGAEVKPALNIIMALILRSPQEDGTNIQQYKELFSNLLKHIYGEEKHLFLEEWLRRAVCSKNLVVIGFLLSQGASANAAVHCTEMQKRLYPLRLRLLAYVPMIEKIISSHAWSIVSHPLFDKLPLELKERVRQQIQLDRRLDHRIHCGNSEYRDALKSRGASTKIIVATEKLLQALNLEEVKDALNQGAEINTIEKFTKDNALHKAIKRGDQPTVHFLVEKEADIHACNYKGEALLHIAASNGDTEVTRFLLAKGLDPNILNYKGETSLHYAAKKNHVATACLLLEKGAIIEACAKRRETPLFYAVKKGHIQMVTFLLDHGAEADALNKDEIRPLHYAAKNGYAVVARILLERGAQANLDNTRSFTPLHYAAMNGHIEVAKVLIKGGAKVNVTDDNGWTPFSNAKYHGHQEMVKFLIEHGAKE